LGSSAARDNEPAVSRATADKPTRALNRRFIADSPCNVGPWVQQLG
jgi:hypothetical protein